MKKFQGILICSDWDGTLHSELGVLEKDINSIRYFQENGGLFTICSGRPLEYLSDFFSEVKPNTYVITLNGAIIISPDTKEILHKGYLEAPAFNVALKLVSAVPGIQKVMVYIDDDVLRHPQTRDEYINNVCNIKKQNAFKIVLLSKTKEDIDLAKLLINYNELGDHIAVCSWSTGLEIIHKNNAKDLATQRVKEATGSKLLVTVGDFENDIDMLKYADISYAVGNASDYVKSFAKRVTCPVTEGAISSIIAELENEIDNSALF